MKKEIFLNSHPLLKKQIQIQKIVTYLQIIKIDYDNKVIYRYLRK